MGTRRLLGGMVVYGSSDALVGVARIVVAALLTRFLTPAEFGLLAVLYTSVMLGIAVAPLGVPWLMLIRFREREPERMRAEKDRAYQILAVSCLGLLALTWISRPLWSGWIGVDTRLVPWCLLWILASVLWFVPSESLRYAGKTVRFSVAKLLHVTVLGVVLGVRWRLLGHIRLIDIVQAEALGALAALIAAHAFDTYLPSLRPRAGEGGLPREVWPLYLLTIGHFVIDLSDRYIIPALMGMEAMGYYGIATRIALAGALTAGAFNSVWQPFFYRSAAAGVVDQSGLRRHSQRLVFLVAVALAAFMVVLPWLARLRLGGHYLIAPTYHGSAVLVAPLLVQYYFRVLYCTAAPAMNFHYRSWRQVAIIGLMGVGGVAGNIAVLSLVQASMFTKLTLAAYVTAVSYLGATLLATRELRRLYPHASVGWRFAALVSPIVLVPLAVPHALAAGLVTGLYAAVGALVVWRMQPRG